MSPTLKNEIKAVLQRDINFLRRRVAESTHPQRRGEALAALSITRETLRFLNHEEN